MDRTAKIATIVANCPCWASEPGKTALNAMTDDMLNSIDPEDEDEDEDEEDNDPVPVPAVNRRQRSPVPIPQAQPLTEQQWMESAPPAVRSVITNALLVEKQAKETVIERLLINVVDARKPVVREMLLKKDLADLQLQAELMPQPVEQFPSVLNFSGAAGGPPAMNSMDDDDILPTQELTFDAPRQATA